MDRPADENDRRYSIGYLIMLGVIFLDRYNLGRADYFHLNLERNNFS